MRHDIPFPIHNDYEICHYLKNIWECGWLDEYSDEHFLIKAIENRLTTFVGYTQMNGRGQRFRMWVLDEKLRHAETTRESDTLFYVTGMKPNDELTQMAMLDCKSKTDSDRVNSSLIGLELVDLVEKYAEKY